MPRITYIFETVELKRVRLSIKSVRNEKEQKNIYIRTEGQFYGNLRKSTSFQLTQLKNYVKL